MTVDITEDLNPSHSHNYSIVIEGKDGQQLTYFARSVTLPGWDVQAIDTPYNGHAFSMPGNSRQRDTVTIEFILSERLTNYKMVRAWGMKAIRGAQDISECFKDITIFLLDSNKNPVEPIKYQDCYPNMVSNLTLESGIVDTMPQTFTVTFSYEAEEW